jgi:DAACS family dicarboxylate/amino acid:cation (Na+ or H+) symporter
MKLWMKIGIGMALGSVLGLWMGQDAVHLKFLGDGFLRLIQMIIVPLIFASMAVGITSIHDPKKLTRLGLSTLLLFLLTTLAAVGWGLLCAFLFKPGAGLHLQATSPLQLAPSLEISQLLLSLIPANPFKAMMEGNVLQLIIFAFLVGIAINLAGPKGQPLRTIFDSLAEVMYQLTTLVMQLSPIGVFGLMAWVTGTFGIQILAKLGAFLLLYYAACCFHFLVVFGGMIRWGVGVKLSLFFKGMADALLMAFSTCSSSATLPIALHSVQENLGVSKSVAQFVLPLGTTLNMNGSALFQAMSAVFIAQCYGIELSGAQLLLITFAATCSAIGAAGIPGTGFIMLSSVLTVAGLPLEGLALIAGIDRVREMISTVLNVGGDAVCALYIAKRENELDLAVYNRKESVPYEAVGSL